MKKIIKLIALPALALFLAACQNTAEEPPAESASVESVAQESTETPASEQSEGSVESGAESTESDAEGTESTESTEGETTEEASETAATFKFFISGEEAAVAEFAVEDAEGLSVLEAMESNADITFNFNEVEGVIDSIEGQENDYTVGNTWTYILNGEYAQLGVVSQTLTAGDQIEWYYGTIDEIPINVVIE